MPLRSAPARRKTGELQGPIHTAPASALARSVLNWLVPSALLALQGPAPGLSSLSCAADFLMPLLCRPSAAPLCPRSGARAAASAAAAGERIDALEGALPETVADFCAVVRAHTEGGAARRFATRQLVRERERGGAMLPTIPRAPSTP